MDERINQGEVVWVRGRWRCEHRIDENGTDWLDLYDRDEVALTRPVKDAAQLHPLADAWQQSVAEGSSEVVMPEPTRRREGDRRRASRGGGRRYEDG